MEFPLSFGLSHWWVGVVGGGGGFSIVGSSAIFINFTTPLGLQTSLNYDYYSLWLICYRVSFPGSVPSIDNLLHVFRVLFNNPEIW